MSRVPGGNVPISPNETPSSGDKDQQLEAILQRIDGLVAGKGTPDNQASIRPAPAESNHRQPSNGNPPTIKNANAPAPAPTENRASGECSFGWLTGKRDEPFIPRIPKDLYAAGVNESALEEIIMRFLLARGEATGRVIADQVKLPFLMIEPILNRLKYEQLTAYRGSNSVGDYTHVLSEQGRERAKQYLQRTTYYGSAPVRMEEYCEAVKYQSVEGQYPRREELLNAFKDLLIDRKMLDKLGPAVNSGRGMFLYGYPGNGKTSIAERITIAFGKYIWIPRAVQVDGEIMRVFDPLLHQAEETGSSGGLLKDSDVDHRWIRIRRPTIIAGGELTMDMLEVQKDRETNINESPMQLKSNCGVLVIDDFGRQRMRVDELLNRWIVPLEKRYDFLNMSSGKKTQVPFDQLVVFSTNLQPKDLVDDAFLRRIPYKIEVENPSETAFRKLFEIMSPKVGLPYRPEMIDYLITNHNKPKNRPFRNCHPRDLLLQIRNLCLYHNYPMEVKTEYIDFACDVYFSIM
ncbi:MAG: AAA family ATPase [Planctomycetales bacterium]|nr:AAA family ATPase [Planctomycetales bacterium]